MRGRARVDDIMPARKPKPPREWPVLQPCGRRHKRSDRCRHCADLARVRAAEEQRQREAASREELRTRNAALRRCADEAETKGDLETAGVLRELAEANETS